MKHFNPKRYALSSLCAFAFVFIFDFLFHGVLLKGAYEETHHLWRRPEDSIFPALILGQLMLPLVAGLIYTFAHEAKGLAEGLRFGVLIGLLLAPGNLILYAVQPIPFRLIGFWISGGVLEAVGIGLIFAATYRPKHA